MLQPLPQAFYDRDTVSVAKDLLGRDLVIRNSSGGFHAETGSDSPIICRIVETEAYTQNDPACHAYQKATGRAATLYKAPGLAYVYFIYGMYFCLNVVTEPEGTAGAVLIRAVEPVLPADGSITHTHGPGRLCKTLGITKALHNEIDLTRADSPMNITEGAPLTDDAIVTTTRIGLSAAQEYPWRFYIRDNAYVSVKEKKARPAKGLHITSRDALL